MNSIIPLKQEEGLVQITSEHSMFTIYPPSKELKTNNKTLVSMFVFLLWYGLAILKLLSVYSRIEQRN